MKFRYYHLADYVSWITMISLPRFRPEGWMPIAGTLKALNEQPWNTFLQEHLEVQVKGSWLWDQYPLTNLVWHGLGFRLNNRISHLRHFNGNLPKPKYHPLLNPADKTSLFYKAAALGHTGDITGLRKAASSNRNACLLHPKFRRFLKDSAFTRFWDLTSELRSLIPSLYFEAIIPQKLKPLANSLLPVTRELAGEELGREYKGIECVHRPLHSSKPDIHYCTSIRRTPLEATYQNVKRLPLIKRLNLPDPKWEDIFGVISVKTNWPISLNSPWIQVGGMAMSSGKGTSKLMAACSLYMEIVERYSSMAGVRGWPFCFEHPIQLTKKRWSELGGQAINPNRFSLLSKYSDEPIYWVVSRRPDGTGVYVPAEMAFINWVADTPAFYDNVSNGLGCGNHLDEAKLHAIYEVLERDSVFSGWNPKLLGRLESVDDECLQTLIERFQKEFPQLFIEVYDATTEFGVPAYLLKMATNKGIIKGFGLDLSGGIALKRALSEFFQAFNSHLRHKDTKMLVPPPPAFRGHLPNYSTGKVANDLHLMETLMEANGVELLYMNLTLNETRIPVVKLLATGLDNHANRYISPLHKRYYRHIHDMLLGFTK
jgi:ribosomal protein S12 methylthiotransferase accessory factor YcaO